MRRNQRLETDIIAHRRRQVSALRTRGLTLAEIVKTLPAQPICCTKPDGRPWSRSTIFADMNWLQDEWREIAAEQTAEHLAGMLAQLREIARSAWTRNRLDLVLKSLAQQAALLGVNAPAKIAQTTPDGASAIPLIDAARQMTTEQLEALAKLRELTAAA